MMKPQGPPWGLKTRCYTARRQERVASCGRRRRRGFGEYQASNAQAKGLTFFLTGERPLLRQKWPTEGAKHAGPARMGALLNLSGKADSEGPVHRMAVDAVMPSKDARHV